MWTTFVEGRGVGMSYKTRRFKEGLSGKKPGSIYIDKEGHQAQESGYRQHLKNRDLAEQIHNQFARDREDSDPGIHPDPLKPRQRVFWFCLGSLLIYWGFLLSRVVGRSWVGMNGGDFWMAFLVSFLLLPGGILVWPGVFLVRFSFDTSE